MKLKVQTIENERCICNIYRDRKLNNVELECIIKDKVDNNNINYFAAASSDTLVSFTGSGIPFPSKEIAFWNTPNIGKKSLIKMKNFSKANLSEGEDNDDDDYNLGFNLKLTMPNSYYNNFKLIQPEVIIKYISNNQNITLLIPVGNKIPYRNLLNNKNRTSPNFYINKNLEIRSQEKILLDSKYPSVNYVPDNFWGTRPTH